MFICENISTLCRNAQECHAELCETLADHAVLYHLLAKWVQVFRSRRGSADSMYKSVQGLSGKYRAIFNISRTGGVTVM